MKSKTKKKIHKILKQKKLTLIFAVAIVFIDLTVLGYMFVYQPNATADERRLVAVYDRGAHRVIATHATTVQEALRAAKIEVDPRDTVEPSLDTRLSDSNEDIIIYRSRLVAVVDGGARQTVLTVAQSPNAILRDANMKSLGSKDKATYKPARILSDGASATLTIKRVKIKAKSERVVFKPRPDALTASKGAHVFVDSAGVAHRETYYDLPMNIVIGTCGKDGKYTIRSDGAKIDQDGYVLIAANLNSYPRCSVVETSLGPGKVYDTGGFAVRHPYGFDLATDWTNYDKQ